MDNEEILRRPDAQLVLFSHKCDARRPSPVLCPLSVTSSLSSRVGKFGCSFSAPTQDREFGGGFSRPSDLAGRQPELPPAAGGPGA